MQLKPRYDGLCVLRIEVPVGDVGVPLVRQRRRLAATLATFDADQWSTPSRCEGWTVQDVVAHLIGTNDFWALSMASGLAGKPTRFLATFDPVATPAAMVEPMRELAPSDVLDRYTKSVDGLAEVVSGMEGDDWDVLAESPPGHVEIRAVALHALWDAWTHERDIVIPLGISQPVEPDEVKACVFYAAAIGPTLAAAGGSSRAGAIGVDTTSPEASFVVEAGAAAVVRPRLADDVVDVELRGDAVDLVEGLTFRAPFTHEVPADHQWLFGGLAEVFDLV